MRGFDQYSVATNFNLAGLVSAGHSGNKIYKSCIQKHMLMGNV